ncbi:MAG: nucleoside triphosphate pyrophosphohydrolase [Chloroflexota bacterium]|nr:nucleoside triphosphate pyrophosphohydrolase [Chloroflexota bacterium]
MRTIAYNKLVRDRIREIIAGRGAKAITRTLDDEKFGAFLRVKLLEEVQEVMSAATRRELITEIADVLEVVRALADLAGIRLEEIETAMRERAASRGISSQRLLLVETREAT